MKHAKLTILCAGCNQPINGDALAFETGALLRFHKPWHRPCHLKTTPEYRLMEKVFRLQDDWKNDPETALSDLIGDLGHFATIKGIDFEEAIRRGVGYWQEERQ